MIAENARKMLAAWPREHYNYRLSEVRQMLSLLDEAIADLRAATGEGRFDLTFTAFTDPPIAGRAARSTADAAGDDRTGAHRGSARRHRDRAAALLETALAGLDRDAAALPADWLATTRAGRGAVRNGASRRPRLSVA